MTRRARDVIHEWRWPDPNRKPRIAPTFARRYPQAAALAQDMGLNVAYAQRIYHAYGDFVSSRQLASLIAKAPSGPTMAT